MLDLEHLKKDRQILPKKDIFDCRVPSHIGIRGNEKSDFSTWQDNWNGVVTNKLHSVKPVLGVLYRRYRKDYVVLCRARIGHTHLTHSYILRKDPPPQCDITVTHITEVDKSLQVKQTYTAMSSERVVQSSSI